MFENRLEAGHQLANRLRRFAGTNARVLGLARGGVLVAAAVAEDLGLPLSVLIVQKVGAPGNPELALGAVSQTGCRWLDTRIVTGTHADHAFLEREIVKQEQEARRRQQAYGLTEQSMSLTGQTAIVVDDGIATGASALVALRSARDLGADRVILAAPVASAQAARKLEREADEVVLLSLPEPFVAVGFHYANFDQATDDDVLQCLQKSRGRDSL